MKRYLFRDLARSLRSPWGFRYMIAVMRQLGVVHPRVCTLCGYEGLFVGHPPRYDAVCPNCQSREGHRLFALMLERHPEFGSGARTVHFAPEPLLANELRRRAADYALRICSFQGATLSWT